ncbi:MAG: hypothetical protein HYS12_11915 [Planctomycetes bacterium]|nr:hypothetical protein [Planctomycetota bacterium]
MNGEADQLSASDAYVSVLQERLVAEGYDLEGDVAFRGQGFRWVAKKQRFELGKFGFVEYFVLLTQYSEVDAQSLREFSADAFGYAALKHTPRKYRLPVALFVFPVIVAASVEEKAIRSLEEDAPAKHFGAFEFPVVYDLHSGTIYFHRKTPFWGRAYYKGMRKLAERLFAP